MTTPTSSRLFNGTSTRSPGSATWACRHAVIERPGKRVRQHDRRPCQLAGDLGHAIRIEQIRGGLPGGCGEVILLDTADTPEIKLSAASGLLDGVTTNASLVAKIG